MNSASVWGDQKTFSELGLPPIGETENASMVTYAPGHKVRIGFERHGFFVVLYMINLNTPVSVARQIDGALEELGREALLASLDKLLKPMTVALRLFSALEKNIDQEGLRVREVFPELIDELHKTIEQAASEER